MSKSNVVPFGSKSRNLDAPRTCDFHTISDNGIPVHGQAAFKVIMKRSGGPDAFLRDLGVRSAEIALTELVQGSGARQKKRGSGFQSNKENANTIDALFLYHCFAIIQILSVQIQKLLLKSPSFGEEGLYESNDGHLRENFEYLVR